MNRTHRKFLVFAIIGVLSAILLSGNARAVIVKANLVANLTTVSVYTVPSGHIARVTSVIISNEGATTANDQRLFRGASTDVTGFITVPGNSTVQVNFNPGIIYTAGQSVQVRNGASSGPMNFTVVIDVEAL